MGVLSRILAIILVTIIGGWAVVLFLFYGVFKGAWDGCTGLVVVVLSFLGVAFLASLVFGPPRSS